MSELAILYRVARRLTLNPQRAEDLVAETLMIASSKWSQFDGRYARSWLLTILRNVHLGEYRKYQKEDATEDIDDQICVSPFDVVREVTQKLTLETILVELDQIPEMFRLAVSLCDVEEMSYEEVARVMECPVGTVRSRLSRGRRLLQSRLVALEVAEPK